MSTLRTATSSCAGFTRLLWHHELRLPRDRIGTLYRAGAGDYTAFRETERIGTDGLPVVLVIGFHLRLIRSNRLLHWLFQRACICTTPFWSGLRGFHTKLWMFNESTKDYIGIYDWRGEQPAQAYIRYLIPILHFFAVKGTVWYHAYPAVALDEFLDERAQCAAPGRRAITVPSAI